MIDMSLRIRKKKLMSEINVVPYIDVMLVLLIIFMITTPLLTEGVKVELPEAKSKPVDIKDKEIIVVTITRKGLLYMDDNRITESKLKSKVYKIMKARPKTEFLVRGDHRVAYGKVVRIMALLQDSGVPTIGLATAPLAKKGR